MNTTKYAVFTVDVEAFADTECLSSSGQRIEVDLMDGLDEYLSVLDECGIKSTMFTVGKLAPKIADRLRRHINNGHRLALHGYDHVAPMKLSVEQFHSSRLQHTMLVRALASTISHVIGLLRLTSEMASMQRLVQFMLSCTICLLSTTLRKRL